MAAEAAENGLLDRSVAQGIVSLKGVRRGELGLRDLNEAVSIALPDRRNGSAPIQEEES
jgi:hypothetical protein